jgi:hypothetical protein
MIEVLNKFGRLVKMITTAREDALFKLVDRNVAKTIIPSTLGVVRPMPIPVGMTPDVQERDRREWYSHDGCNKSCKKSAHPCWKAMSKRPRQYKVGQPSGRMLNTIIYERSYCR